MTGSLINLTFLHLLTGPSPPRSLDYSVKARNEQNDHHGLLLQTLCRRGVSSGARPTLLALPEEPTVDHLLLYRR